MAFELTGRAKEDSGSLFEFLLPALPSVSAEIYEPEILPCLQFGGWCGLRLHVLVSDHSGLRTALERCCCCRRVGAARPPSRTRLPARAPAASSTTSLSGTVAAALLLYCFIAIVFLVRHVIRVRARATRRHFTMSAAVSTAPRPPPQL